MDRHFIKWQFRADPAGNMKQKRFFILAVFFITAIHLLFIGFVRSQASHPDIRIYQWAGQLVLAGVNPYDFDDQKPVREAVKNGSSGPANFIQRMDQWDYYVSSNLPMSEILYAAIEYASGGSRTVWRIFLILGDILIFFGLVALVRSTGGNIEDPATQIGIACLSIFNPLLLKDGGFTPEDKQFQTALLLFGAALLLSRSSSTRHYIKTGLVLSVGIFFKMFGIFLAPLWLQRAVPGRARFLMWTLAAGLVPAILSFALFGDRFIPLMFHRARDNSIGAAAHASPWVLIPDLAGHPFLIAKLVISAACAALLAALLFKKRIDTLNFCAGAAVIFGCIWLDAGSLDRMNIAIIFAIAALMSLKPEWFSALAVLNLIAGAVTVVFSILVYEKEEIVEAVYVLFFLIAYFATLAHPGPKLGLEMASGWISEKLVRR